MDAARHAIDELKGLERGSLRIGASTTPGMYLIPRTIAQFKKRYPKIVHLAVKDIRQIEEGVIRSEFDFGFVGGHLTGDEVDVLPWITAEIWHCLHFRVCGCDRLEGEDVGCRKDTKR